MYFFTLLLGKIGMAIFIGILSFLVIYKFSISLFQWIEDKTYDTRDYILKKLELLHITLAGEKITYLLMFSYFGMSLLVFTICAIFGAFLAGAILAVLLCVLGFILPKQIVDSMYESRLMEYSNQMVDGLNLLANGIRAGLTVPQALGMVVQELPAPISQEFNQILQETKIGVPLEEAFENLNKRVPIEDNEMFVTSMNILRETGGNLAEVFDTIVFVIRERIRIKQKIDTYVAQGKMQGGTIFCMPFAMGFIQYMSDPEGVTAAMSSPIGIIAMTLALLLDLAGGFVILKIVKIKV